MSEVLAAVASAADELAQLREEKRVLGEQVKLLSRIEQHLHEMQRGSERQLRRIEALNRFALTASSGASAEQIVEHAIDLLFSLFPFDQGVGLMVHDDGILRPLVVRALAGSELQSRERLAEGRHRDEMEVEAVGLTATPRCFIAATLGEAAPVPRRLIGIARALFDDSLGRDGDDDDGDDDDDDRAAWLCVPLIGRHESAVGVLVLQNPRADLISAHEALPGAGDMSFVQLVAAHVSAALEAVRLYSEVCALANVRNLFASKVVEAQEQERSRVARELHDAIAQQLVAMRMDAEWVAAAVAEDSDRRGVADQLTQRLADSIVAIRNIVYDLRPPMLDDLGVASALKAYAGQISRRAPIRCEVDIIAEPEELPFEVATAVYRIAQEGINNVVKHAGATTVRISLEDSGETVILRVRDDGCGMAPDEVTSPTSLGLLNMRERASLLGGELVVTTRRGVGTTIGVAIPYAHHDGGGADAGSTS